MPTRLKTLPGLALLRRKYRVQDPLGPARSGRRFRLLVFESPHRQEIQKKIPVCGPAGLAMAGLVAGSLGEWVACPRRVGALRQKMEQTVIVNLCPIPLQKSAYRPEDVRPARHRRLFAFFERLRRSVSSKALREKLKPLFAAYLEPDLRRRLRSLPGKPDYVFLCGELANAYFPKAWARAHWGLSEDRFLKLPHPSALAYGHAPDPETLQKLRR